jgi:hypothetical protein
MHEPDNTLAVSVTVDLARDRDAMRASIIEAIANKVLYGVSYDEDGDPCSVPTKISSDLRNAMYKAVNAEVEKHVGPAVEAALAEGVQRTNEYGSPRGEKVPLRAVIVEEAQKALGKKVEYRDNYGRSENVVSAIIRNEVQQALAKDLKGVVEAEREKVQQAVRDEAASIITQAVQRAARAVA